MTDQICVHCNPTSSALSKPLLVTNNFYVVSDAHPLVQGHILIIPKNHITCAGAFHDELFAEFFVLYRQFSKFIKNCYGSVSSFEHGVVGQTVFHAHVHLLPYKGKIQTIIPEGKDYLYSVSDVSDIQNLYQRNGKYLLFSIDDTIWSVDTKLGEPRFFRDRFAKALGCPERGNWKAMEADLMLMNKAKNEINLLLRSWKHYNKIHQI